MTHPIRSSFSFARVGLMASFLLVGTAVRADDFKETQGFFDFEINKKLAPNWSVFLNHQSKIQDNDPEYFLWHMRGGVRYEVAPWLRAAIDHRHQEDRDKGDWIREGRSTLELTPKVKLGGWALSSRNRMEYRDFEGAKPDRWRYRNEIKAAHALPFWDLSGYLSEEPQYDFEQDRWSKHRITAGVSREVACGTKLQLYYRWDVIEDSKAHGSWDTTQIFGLKLVMNMDALVKK